jgi:hypothetical protein
MQIQYGKSTIHVPFNFTNIIMREMFIFSFLVFIAGILHALRASRLERLYTKVMERFLFILSFATFASCQEPCMWPDWFDVSASADKWYNNEHESTNTPGKQKL